WCRLQNVTLHSCKRGEHGIEVPRRAKLVAQRVLRIDANQRLQMTPGSVCATLPAVARRCLCPHVTRVAGTGHATSARFSLGAIPGRSLALIRLACRKEQQGDRQGDQRGEPPGLSARRLVDGS